MKIIKNLTDYFRKPLPALAFGSTLVMAILKLVGVMTASWWIVALPVITLFGIYAVLTVVILISIGIFNLIEKRENNAK